MCKKRIIALIAVCGIMLTGCKVEYSEETLPSSTAINEATSKTIRVRYSDESYKEYFEYCETLFETEHSDTDVILDLVSSENYVENIGSDSLSGTDVPDVYLIENSELGTAYLAGLAAKNTVDKFNSENYCDTAINACSCNGNLIGYPLGFKTSFLAYNTDFLTADNVKTFAALEEYSDNATFSQEDAAEIETIFRCNITELFANYGFVGSNINTGGTYGDDTSKVDINNGNIKSDAEKYLSIIDYFSLNPKASSSWCAKNFVAGKFLSTIYTTDYLGSLSKAQINYEIAEFPDYDNENSTAPLSITSALAVNPYASDIELAKEFAEFATYQTAEEFYNYVKLPSARKGVKYEIEQFKNIYASYEKSVPKNKLQYGDQIYPLVEIALHNIAAGEDIEGEFKKIDNYMKDQISN